MASVKCLTITYIIILYVGVYIFRHNSKYQSRLVQTNKSKPNEPKSPWKRSKIKLTWDATHMWDHHSNRYETDNSAIEITLREYGYFYLLRPASVNAKLFLGWMKNMNHVRKYSLYRPLHITQSSSFDLRIENMIENILQNYFNFCEIVGRFLFFDGSFLSKRKLITIFVRCPFNTQYAYQFSRRI